MIPVFQAITSKEGGDCHRASIASLFDLDITQVPNFRLFDQERWSYVLSGFLWGLGYDWDQNGFPDKNKLSECESVNGYFETNVPSNYEGYGHSVIINTEGIVVHDPLPTSPWINKNVLESGNLIHWMIIKKQKVSKVANS